MTRAIDALKRLFHVHEYTLSMIPSPYAKHVEKSIIRCRCGDGEVTYFGSRTNPTHITKKLYRYK